MEQVLRYFVVHNYVCNGGSYTGSMIHNYYLYEENGQLAMLPWDYNLAYGTFQGGSAQSTVNTPIDAPVSGGSGDDRPMGGNIGDFNMSGMGTPASDTAGRIWILVSAAILGVGLILAKKLY